MQYDVRHPAGPALAKPARGERPGEGIVRQPIGAAMRSVLLPFWRSRASIPSWLMLGAIAASLYAEVRLAIWSNALEAALSQGVLDKADAVFRSTLLTIGLVIAFIALNAALFHALKQMVIIAWRRWLTDRLRSRWLAGDAFYRIERDGGIDNADQRLAEDCALAVSTAVVMTIDLAAKLAQIAGFSAVLWSVGGAERLDFAGLRGSVPGGMVWAAVLFQGLGSAITLWLGYPLIRLTVARQRHEADFRFAMANLRVNAEQIALYRGERVEDTRLRGHFTGVVDNWHRIMGYTARVTGYTDFHNQASLLLSQILAWERYFAGRIGYGEIFILGAAFLRVSFGLNWLMQWFTQGSLYTWAAAVRRLDALQLELGRTPVSGIALCSGAEAELATHGLRLARPDGTPLATVGDRRFAPGERWLVQGASGTGKSTMMRALAGLWPYGAGEVVRPADGDMLFLPQKSYVPEGSLHAALCYPSDAGRFDRAACAAVLDAVRLSAFVARLDEDARWQERLSPGEQQRLAFARVLLHQPDVVLLDEATSALDVDNERHLYELLDRRLPDAAIVSIGHRDTLERFHPHRLSLDGIA